MRRLFKFKYPKLFILLLSIILAYILFRYTPISDYLSSIGSLSYLGVFIAGMLFAFGFSAPFAVVFFLALNPSNLWIAGIIGGLGALTSDLLIFNFIKISFEDEFKRLNKEKALRKFKKIMGEGFGRKIRKYLMYAFAGILIASPLPDEAGIIMLAGLTRINQFVLGIVGFILNTAGILVLLSI